MLINMVVCFDTMIGYIGVFRTLSKTSMMEFFKKKGNCF